jgi:uncharacterized membrane protein YhdT
MARTAARSTALPVAVGLFGLGLLAIVAVFVLYATGHGDLPVWLNLATLLAPLGLAVGVITVIVRNRRD